MLPKRVDPKKLAIELDEITSTAASLINVDVLGARIKSVVDGQMAIAHALNALQEKIGLIVTKEEVDRFKEQVAAGLGAHEERLETMDRRIRRAAAINDALPGVRKQMIGAVDNMEARRTSDMGPEGEAIESHIQKVESEAFAKGLDSDLELIRSGMHGFRKEELVTMHESVVKMNDEQTNRIKGVDSQTFALRAEQEAKHFELQEHGAAMEIAVDARAAETERKIDESMQAAQTDSFIEDTERKIENTAALEEMEKMQYKSSSAIQGVHTSVQAGMDRDRGIVERTGTVLLGLRDMYAESVPKPHLVPIAAQLEDIEHGLEMVEATLPLKMEEAELRKAVSSLEEMQAKQGAELPRKADAEAVEERHKKNVAKTHGALQILKDQEEQLKMVIDMLEYNCAGVDQGMAGKADKGAMNKEVGSNTAMQGEMDSLEGELQSTLLTLEGMVLDGNDLTRAAPSKPRSLPAGLKSGDGALRPLAESSGAVTAEAEAAGTRAEMRAAAVAEMKAEAAVAEVGAQAEAEAGAGTGSGAAGRARAMAGKEARAAAEARARAGTGARVAAEARRAALLDDVEKLEAELQETQRLLGLAEAQRRRAQGESSGHAEPPRTPRKMSMAAPARGAKALLLRGGAAPTSPTKAPPMDRLAELTGGGGGGVGSVGGVGGGGGGGGDGGGGGGDGSGVGLSLARNGGGGSGGGGGGGGGGSTGGGGGVGLSPGRNGGGGVGGGGVGGGGGSGGGGGVGIGSSMPTRARPRMDMGEDAPPVSGPPFSSAHEQHGWVEQEKQRQMEGMRHSHLASQESVPVGAQRTRVAAGPAAGSRQGSAVGGWNAGLEDDRGFSAGISAGMY